MNAGEAMSRRVVLRLIDSFGAGGAQQRYVNDLAHLGAPFDHGCCSVFADSADPPSWPLSCQRRSLAIRQLRDLPIAVVSLAVAVANIQTTRRWLARSAAQPASIPDSGQAGGALAAIDMRLSAEWSRPQSAQDGRPTGRHVVRLGVSGAWPRSGRTHSGGLISGGTTRATSG